MRIVFWGTYDTGKPRVRILLRGLRENGAEVIECHRDIWKGVEDKSQVSGLADRFVILWKWIAAYPVLIYRYLRLPRHDVVVVGYMGQLDVLVLWPFARLRKVPLVWDALLSLFNTVVEDRRLLTAGSLPARLLFHWEKSCCRAADRVILDTDAHGSYFIDTFGLSPEKVRRVFVGAEQERFPPRADRRNGSRHASRAGSNAIKVLFYGQLIPLHGVETIIRAARRTGDSNIDWMIIGTGQEGEALRTALKEQPVERLEWLPWVPYRALVDYLHGADICLGIFGDTDKAARVIPNKVFQVIAAGLPLITRDSPAIRELVPEGTSGIVLVPPADPQALVQAVHTLWEVRAQWRYPLHRDLAREIAAVAIGRNLLEILRDVRKPVAERRTG